MTTTLLAIGVCGIALTLAVASDIRDGLYPPDPPRSPTVRRLRNVVFFGGMVALYFLARPGSHPEGPGLVEAARAAGEPIFIEGYSNY